MEITKREYELRMIQSNPWGRSKSGSEHNMKELEKSKGEKEAQKKENYVRRRGSWKISTGYCNEKESQRELLVVQPLLFCCTSMKTSFPHIAQCSTSIDLGRGNMNEEQSDHTSRRTFRMIKSLSSQLGWDQQYAEMQKFTYKHPFRITLVQWESPFNVQNQLRIARMNHSSGPTCPSQYQTC